MQDSIIGVAVPAPLGALYRDIMSPYCPGLTLASCPSPQADSLRKAIAVRFETGESVASITESLVAHYGPSVRGTPAFEGFGTAAFLVPVLLLLGGGLFILRWLRRNTQRAPRAALFVVAIGSLAGAGCAPGGDRAAAGSAASTDTPLPAEPAVTGAWVRVGTAGGVTGAYGTIVNPEADTLRIIGAASPVADTVELHETMQHDGMVHMEPQPALRVPPRDSVVLAPGGKHLMVRQLLRDLVVGEQVSFQLLLADGRALPFPVEVRSLDGRTVAAGSSSASGAPRMMPGKRSRAAP